MYLIPRGAYIAGLFLKLSADAALWITLLNRSISLELHRTACASLARASVLCHLAVIAPRG
jgi:hypothetical protein